MRSNRLPKPHHTRQTPLPHTRTPTRTNQRLETTKRLQQTPPTTPQTMGTNSSHRHSPLHTMPTTNQTKHTMGPRTHQRPHHMDRTRTRQMQQTSRRQTNPSPRRNITNEPNRHPVPPKHDQTPPISTRHGHPIPHPDQPITKTSTRRRPSQEHHQSTNHRNNNDENLATTSKHENTNQPNANVRGVTPSTTKPQHRR